MTEIVERPREGREPAADAAEALGSVSPGVPGARSRRSAAVPRTVGVVAALLVAAAGVVAGQEALASAGVAGLQPEDGWLRAAVERLDGLALDGAVVGFGVLGIVAGLALLVAAGHSGAGTTRLRTVPAIELRTQDVARLASAAAEDVDGVLDASSSAGPRSVTVRVTTTGASQAPTEVEEAVRRRLDLLAPAPRVRVRATTAGGAS